MANDLMFLSRQVLEHTQALLIARLKFQEARVAELEAALRAIEKTTRSSSGGWLATFMGVRLNDANRAARVALKGTDLDRP